MAASIFALFDDVAALMDDVASASKIAIKKAAGVTGDDFAVTANQVGGIPSHRELPVIWRIVKGSLLNKFGLLVALLLIAEFAPFLISYLLIFGALYLAVEGSEKVISTALGHHDESEDKKAESEDDVVRGAIMTDLVLSAEIMIIALGAVSGSVFLLKLGVLSAIAVAITFGIYGMVALLIRLDDIGLYLINKGWVKVGTFLIELAPKIMRLLGVVGTVAVFMVAGGILVHNVELFEEIASIIEPMIGLTLYEILLAFFNGVFFMTVIGFVEKFGKFFKKDCCNA